MATRSADLMDVKADSLQPVFDQGVSEENGATILICPEYGNCYPFLSCGLGVAVERAA